MQNGSSMDFRNLVITGFMGSGKSTTGKLLATKLSLPFLETDTEILKSSEFSSIAEIITTKGEGYFRTLERSILEELLQSDKQVISLGGGTICQEGISDLFHPDDYILFLEVPFEVCAQRIREQEKNHNTPARPLFKDETSARELFNKREKIYKYRSRLHIPAGSQSAEETVSSILRTLTNK
jgi:shikimate kinase